MSNVDQAEARRKRREHRVAAGSACKTTLQGDDGRFDREFWAALTPEQRVMQVWEISRDAYLIAGMSPEELDSESRRPRSSARVFRR